MHARIRTTKWGKEPHEGNTRSAKHKRTPVCRAVLQLFLFELLVGPKGPPSSAHSCQIHCHIMLSQVPDSARLVIILSEGALGFQSLRRWTTPSVACDVAGLHSRRGGEVVAVARRSPTCIWRPRQAGCDGEAFGADVVAHESLGAQQCQWLHRSSGRRRGS